MADSQPPQQQEPPGETAAMERRPQDEMRDYAGRDLLRHKRALITGGDSGIGRDLVQAKGREVLAPLGGETHPG